MKKRKITISIDPTILDLIDAESSHSPKASRSSVIEHGMTAYFAAGYDRPPKSPGEPLLAPSESYPENPNEPDTLERNRKPKLNKSFVLSPKVYPENTNDTDNLDPPTHTHARAVGSILLSEESVSKILDLKKTNRLTDSTHTGDHGGEPSEMVAPGGRKGRALEGWKVAGSLPGPIPDPDGLDGLRWSDFADFCRAVFRPEEVERMKELARALLDSYTDDQINAASWKYLQASQKKDILSPIRYLKTVVRNISDEEVLAWKRGFYRRNEPAAPTGPQAWRPPPVPNDLLSYEENRKKCQELIQLLAKTKTPWPKGS